jgi:hypothetical protein
MEYLQEYFQKRIWPIMVSNINVNGRMENMYGFTSISHKTLWLSNMLKLTKLKRAHEITLIIKLLSN